MPLLRYYDKNSGTVHLYEILPDEYTASGAPKRKYVGIEGPDGELIPSSGKRGRKPGFSPKKSSDSEEYKEQIDQLSEEVRDLKHQLVSAKQVGSQYDDLISSLEKLLNKHRLNASRK